MVATEHGRALYGGVAGNAEKGLGETRAYALMPQPETRKISCVHRLPCARLSQGADHSMHGD